MSILSKKNQWIMVNQDHLMDFIVSFSKNHISEEEAMKISLKNIMDFIDEWIKDNPRLCSTMDE